MNDKLTVGFVIRNINKTDLDFLVKNNMSGVFRTFIDNIFLYEDASNFEKKMSIIFKCVKDIEDQLSPGNKAPIPKNGGKNWPVKLTEKQYKFVKKVYLHKEFSLFLNQMKEFSYSNNSNMRAYIICNLFDRYTSKPSLYYAIEDIRLMKKATELEELEDHE